MSYLYGPDVGRRHDMTLHRESNLDKIVRNALIIDRRQYCLYGVAAYVLIEWLQTAFIRSTSSTEQVLYNTAMSAVREAVKCTYKDLKQMCFHKTTSAY